MSGRIKSGTSEVTASQVPSHPFVIEDDDDDDDDDDEEEIVREIDVFLSPQLSEQLHLVQFPLQRKVFSSPESARMKPRHCKIELDYRTPSDDIGDLGSYQMSRRTYKSHTIPVSTHMTLGRMVNEPGSKGLHLIPLSRITQMRPSFSHIDEATTCLTATVDDDIVKREAEASSIERKPLTFQKKESDRAAMARKSTYAYKKASEESEPWNNLEVYDKDSPEANDIMGKVICPSMHDNLMTEIDKNNPEFPSSEQYASTLNYLPLSYKINEKEEDADEISSVCAKLVRFLQEGWPIPFLVLKDRFPESIIEETLFQALGSCAFLVRGNFVLHSKLMPLSPSVAHARTFILFLFQTIDVIHRSRLENVYANDDQVNTETIFMLLNQVGKKSPEGWRLKVEDDTTFAEKYHETLLVHLNFWASQLRRFQPLLDLYRQALE
jgi:DNA-directed RNA polymerase-3 subunit RPC5